MHDGFSPHEISRKRITTVLVVILLSCVVLGSSGTRALKAHAAGNASDDQKAALYCLQGAFSSIAQRAEPGVVSITAVQHINAEKSSRSDKEAYIHGRASANHRKKAADSDEDGDLLLQLFPPERSEPVKASGSGTIVSRVGDAYYVLTNYHVVEDTYQVDVQLSDKTDLKGIVVGTDPLTDIAVVRISSPKLSDRNIVAMGDSNQVKVGDWALAVGTPYGFEQTLTVGVVSALHRELTEEDSDYPDLIQTDAAINRGNSGGPLLDVEGEIVGVNAAIASPTGGSVGLGFAIPINVARDVFNDLVSSGRVVRGWIGVGVQEMTPVLKEFYSAKGGVLVVSVDEKSPATTAGIRSEDIVTTLEGKPVNGVRQLQQLVSEATPGSTAQVGVLRGGKAIFVSVKVGVSPLTPAGRPSPPSKSSDAGIKVRTLPNSLAKEIGLMGVSGVVVTQVRIGSAADEADLEIGDVVLRFNGHDLNDDVDFSRRLKSIAQGGIIVLKIIRKGTVRIIGFQTE
jgi:serine protease Do